MIFLWSVLLVPGSAFIVIHVYHVNTPTQSLTGVWYFSFSISTVVPVKNYQGSKVPRVHFSLNLLHFWVSLYWGMQKFCGLHTRGRTEGRFLPSATTACCSPLCSPGAAVSEPTIRRRLAASLAARHSARCESRHTVRSATAILRPGTHPAPAGWRCSCTGHVGCGEASSSSPHLLPLLHRCRHLLLFSGFFQLLLVLCSQQWPHQRRLTRCKAAESPATPNWEWSLSWRPG